MKIIQNDQNIDLLNMTRIEVANVILIARKDLSLNETLAAAERLNDVIHSQFPESSKKDRVKISGSLAKQLGDPNPYRVAVIMRSFYARKRCSNSDSSGEDGEFDCGTSRCRGQSAQER